MMPVRDNMRTMRHCWADPQAARTSSSAGRSPVFLQRARAGLASPPFLSVVV